MSKLHKLKNKDKRCKALRFFINLLVICAVIWFLLEYGPSFLGFNEGPWNLTLVNSTHAVPDNWEIELTHLLNNQQVDSRVYPHLQEMFDACRAAGLAPTVVSSYRTAAEQEREFTGRRDAFIAEGYSESEAEELTSDWVAKPNYSEHQMGLAVDIGSGDFSISSNEAVWEWASEHCADYGFILRYPPGKEDITDCSYEPWHFRYVGSLAANAIKDEGITLEEYLNETY